MTTVSQIVSQEKLQNDILEINTTSIYSCKVNIGYKILQAAWRAITFEDEPNQDILKKIDVATKRFQLYPNWAKEITSYLMQFENEKFVAALERIYEMEQD